MNKFDPTITLNSLRAPRTTSEAFKGAEYGTPITCYKKSFLSDSGPFFLGVLFGAIMAAMLVPLIVH